MQDNIHEYAVSRYCRLYSASGKTPAAFAGWARVHIPALCLAVLEIIGSWPSSEPELRALQARS